MYENTLRISKGEERKWTLSRVSDVTTHIVKKYGPHKVLQDPACFYCHPVFIMEMTCKVSDVQIIARQEVEPQNPCI